MPEYNTLNYSDDIAGVKEGQRADTSFKKMGRLLTSLGLEEASEKASPPATSITYLGVLFDSISFRKKIPPEKVSELLDYSYGRPRLPAPRGGSSHCVESSFG